MTTLKTFDQDVSESLGLTFEEVEEIATSDAGIKQLRKYYVPVSVPLTDTGPVLHFLAESGQMGCADGAANQAADAMVEALAPLVADFFPEKVQ